MKNFKIKLFTVLLQKENPKLLISNISLPSIEQNLLFFKNIKNNFKVKTILIGPIAKLFKKEILKEGYVDYIIINKEELMT